MKLKAIYVFCGIRTFLIRLFFGRRAYWSYDDKKIRLMDDELWAAHKEAEEESSCDVEDLTRSAGKGIKSLFGKAKKDKPPKPVKPTKKLGKVRSQSEDSDNPETKKQRLSRLPVIIDLIRWLAVDIFRFFKRGKQVRLYGIWCFVGIYGGGKTMSLVHYLERMRERYGDKIYICTNFYYTGQDFDLDGWRDILKDYDKPIIFAYDELQNEFNSRDYRNFPIPLMGELTQNRKGLGKQIVYTTQDYETVDKNFRRLTTQVAACRTYFGRLTRCKYYKREFYENLVSTVSIERKFKIRPTHTDTFVQSDYLRSRYDSFRRLKSVRLLEYNERVVSGS